MSERALPLQIEALIIDYARQNLLMKGAHLPAQKLADKFRVSRWPVNEALKVLERKSVVRREPNRGYFLAMDPAEAADELDDEPDPEAGEEVYFQIADARLSGLLPDRISESKLMRLYGLSRNEALKILNRMAREGWMARLPGRGWEFLPTLTSGEAYRMAYQFRIAIEPSALLQPTWSPNEIAFRRAREQQLALLDGDYLRLSRAQLFQINSGFHELIVECSNNIYFIESIKRANASRRLAEYRKTIDRARLVGQALEHIRVLDLIESGEMAKAAEFLKQHLKRALELKSDSTLPPL